MMQKTITLTSWHPFKVDGCSDVEYVCDYYYKDGKVVGNSGVYYTGRYR